VPKSFQSGRTGNRLLNLLPPDEYERLQPHLRKVEISVKQTLYEPHGRVEQIYFPTNAVLSAVTIMMDGSAIEVATTGNEGMSGLPAFGVIGTSPHRVFAQIAGSAWQADGVALSKKLGELAKFREIISRYQEALLFQISQCVACNGLHVIVERCCRWLLMTHDRVDGDEMALTHEFLSYMLGCRRSSVTETLQSLQQQGLIRYGQGKITVLDRGRLEEFACECYQNVRAEYDRMLGSPS
jgi:CRP-like cAMP-binding protein